MHDNLAGLSLTLPLDALAGLNDVSGHLTTEPVTGTGGHH
jgi:hypothetical protein